jgi:carbon storage regulator
LLILSRKKDESILIGKNIKITVIGFQKNQVKIGIEAPEDLAILREELVFEVQQENVKALKVDVTVLTEISKLVNQPDKNHIKAKIGESQS